MNLLLEILFIVTLGFLFYQDMKERKVSVWILIVGIFLGVLIHFSKQPTIVFLSNVGINCAIVSLIFGVLWLYAKLKLKKRIFEVFGLGDLLFFLLLAMSLPILSFLILFVFSLIFSLVVFIILKSKWKEPTVPLAGLQSLFLSLVFIANKFINSIDIYAL